MNLLPHPFSGRTGFMTALPTPINEKDIFAAINPFHNLREYLSSL
jgi:hypothetical protein